MKYVVVMLKVRKTRDVSFRDDTQDVVYQIWELGRLAGSHVLRGYELNFAL